MSKKSPIALTAAASDPHRLYELSVQDPETEVSNIDAIFRSRRDARPLSLREDFCGTAKLSTEWVQSHPARTAVGLDIDPEVLSWARENNISGLGSDRKRIKLLNRDVLKGNGRADVVVALNFSYWVFHDRPTLVRYFRSVRRGLSEDGVFIINLHGGPEAQTKLRERTAFDGFTYVWDQGEFDPISNRAECCIHFRFPDGTAIERAFVYDWRIWSLPELRDAMNDAGFSAVDVWWEDGDTPRLTKSCENKESWLAHLAAWR